MSLPPEVFPLERIDSVGVVIKEGDVVEILHIPVWLLKDLDEASLEAVKACKGTKMKIYEIDKYGYAWVETATLETESEYASNSFCMEPKNLLKQ